MKKTIEKLFKDSKFLEQIKSTPKQVKMFFGGLLVIVVAVAFVLPSISGKMLQGSVLNLGFSTSNKVDGYGYSYQPLGKCFLIEDNNEIKISCPKTSSTYPQELIDAYNYAYEMGFITTSIDNTPLGGTILEGESINILNIFADKFDLQEINQPGEPSNNEATRSFFIIKLVKMVWPANYSNNQEIYAKAKSEGLISSTNPEQLADPQVRVYAYKLLKVVDDKLSQQNNICQTPENVLACTLHLSSCPLQCRPAICQTPENVLACSLGLDSCPTECSIYGSNNTGEIIKDVAITNIHFTADNNRMAKVIVNLKNVGTVKMPIESVKTKLYIDGNQLLEGTYGLSIDSIPSSLSPGAGNSFIANIFLTGGDLFTYDSVITADVSTYPEKDQNPNNNYNKAYLTGNINGDLKKDEPVEEPAIVEEVREEKVEEKIEERVEENKPVEENLDSNTKKESNKTFMEMVRSLVE